MFKQLATSVKPPSRPTPAITSLSSLEPSTSSRFPAPSPSKSLDEHTYSSKRLAVSTIANTEWREDRGPHYQPLEEIRGCHLLADTFNSKIARLGFSEGVDVGRGLNEPSVTLRQLTLPQIWPYLKFRRKHL